MENKKIDTSMENEESKAELESSAENIDDISESSEIGEAQEEIAAGEISEDAEPAESNDMPESDSDNIDGEESDSEEEAEEEQPKTESVEGNNEIEDENSRTEENEASQTERITGEKHSNVTTAAPIRTRSPEQNREVTNGIPVRERKTEAVEDPEPANTKRTNFFAVFVAAALAVILLLSCAVFLINRYYSNYQAINGAADYDMTYVPEEDSLIDVGEYADLTGTESPEKYTVTLKFFGRDDITAVTDKVTFAELLEMVGCTLTETDRPSVGMDSLITSDMEINIDKVEKVNVAVTEDIQFEVEKIETDLIPRGETNYISQGENGMKEVVYCVEYVNGVETGRTFVSENITKQPVNEVYEYGVGGSFVGKDGITYTYSYKKIVPATHYSLEGPTYIGPDADETVIAIDPNYIPMNTVLYVKNDKYDFGKRIAADTSSMIKEWEVYIWLDKNNPQYNDFASAGYHYDMEIYYIDQ